MNHVSSNPCTRCGKERILLRKWKEQVPTLSGTFIEVTRSDNICPDPECQEKVQAELDKQKANRKKVNDERKARIEASREEKARIKILGKNIIAQEE